MVLVVRFVPYFGKPNESSTVPNVPMKFTSAFPQYASFPVSLMTCFTCPLISLCFFKISQIIQ